MSLFRSGTVLFVASMAGNLCNYLFQFFMSRNLSLDDYGALNAALSLTAIIGIPTGTVMMVVARYAATFNAREEAGNIAAFYRNSLLWMTLAGALFFAAMWAVSAPIAEYLKIRSPFTITIVGAGLFLSFILTVNMGMLQGLQKFSVFGAGIWVGSAARLALGILLVVSGLGLNGAVAATVLPGLLVIALTLPPLSARLKPKPGAVKATTDIISYSVPVLLSSLAFTAMTNIDMIMIKHIASPEEAGFYSAVSVLGKTMLYLPAAFVLALFPMISDSFARNGDIYRILDKGLLYTVIFSLAGISVFIIAPEAAVKMLFGHKFISAAPLLKFYGMAMMLMAVVSVLINFNLARGKTGFIYSLGAGSIGLAVLINAFHETLLTVIVIMCAVNSVVAATNLYLAYRDRKPLDCVVTETESQRAG